MKKIINTMGLGSLVQAVVLTLGAVLFANAATAGTFTRLDDVPFEGSADDNGTFWTPTLLVGTAGSGATLSGLVNGEDSSMFWNSEDQVQAFQFTLGGDCPQRHLTRVDIWMPGFDSLRKAYNYTLLVSSNNTDWAAVANSGFQNPDALAGSVNLARFEFDDPETTRGFRYLIVSNNHATATYAARLSEIDIHTENDPFQRRDNVDFEPALDDAIHGRQGWAILSGINNTDIMQLTDGKRSNTFFHSKPHVTAFLLGSPNPDRYLTGVDIWMGGAEGSRRGYDYTLRSSTNGVDWAIVSHTGWVDPGATYDNNLARFRFDDPDLTRGIQYLSISNHTGTVNPTRIHEYDVFTAGDIAETRVEAMNLDQSWTDAIQGKLPTVTHTWVENNGRAALTDAESADAPSATTYPNTSDPSSITWQVGSGKATEYLSRIDFWLPNSTAVRARHRFTIQTSADGDTFATVADTGYTGASTYSNATYRVRMDFAEGAAPQFQHVRMITWPTGNNQSAPPGGSTKYGTRVVEIDLFTDWLPPSGSLIMLR